MGTTNSHNRGSNISFSSESDVHVRGSMASRAFGSSLSSTGDLDPYSMKTSVNPKYSGDSSRSLSDFKAQGSRGKRGKSGAKDKKTETRTKRGKSGAKDKKTETRTKRGKSGAKDKKTETRTKRGKSGATDKKTDSRTKRGKSGTKDKKTEPRITDGKSPAKKANESDILTSDFIPSPKNVGAPSNHLTSKSPTGMKMEDIAAIAITDRRSEKTNGLRKTRSSAQLYDSEKSTSRLSRTLKRGASQANFRSSVKTLSRVATSADLRGGKGFGASTLTRMQSFRNSVRSSVKLGGGNRRIDDDDFMVSGSRRPEPFDEKIDEYLPPRFNHEDHFHAPPPFNYVGSDHYPADPEPIFSFYPPPPSLPTVGTEERQIYEKRVEEEEILLEQAKSPTYEEYPNVLGRGCYLKYNPGGVLIAQWSQVYVTDAVAFFYPRKEISEHRFNTNLGVVELVRNVQTKRSGKATFAAWMNYIKLAYDSEGVLKILEEKEGEFYYVDDESRVTKILPNQWLETHKAAAFAILPLYRVVFKGVKTCKLSRFEDMANTSGGGSWKPLQRYTPKEGPKPAQIDLYAKPVHVEPTHVGKSTHADQSFEQLLPGAKSMHKSKMKGVYDLLPPKQETPLPDPTILSGPGDLETEKGCYLKFDSKEGVLLAQWSEVPVEGSLAFFFPQKPIAQHKYKTNAVVQLIKGLRSNKKDKAYYSGWLNYLKTAYDADGVVKIFKESEGDFFYLDDSNNIKKVVSNQWFTTNEASAIAVIPSKKTTFKGMNTCSASNFEDLANTSGGGVWKPLKKLKRKTMVPDQINMFERKELERIENEDKEPSANDPETENQVQQLNNSVSVEEEYSDLGEGKGCYLKVDSSKGVFLAQWSEIPVPGAIAFFYAQKKIPQRKFKSKTTEELVRGIKSSRKDKIYYAGWLHYLKIAHSVDGVLKILSKNTGEFYYLDNMNGVHKLQPDVWFETTEAQVFAVLPPQRTVYKGMKECSLSKFEDLANTSDGGTWKPLRRYKRMSTPAQKTLNDLVEKTEPVEEEIIQTLPVEEVINEEFEFSIGEDIIKASDTNNEAGCYLRVDKSKGTLVAEWSKKPVGKAIAFFYPKKKVAQHKYQSGFNVIELVRGVGRSKDQSYYIGWLHFLKIAYDLQGVVKIFAKKEGEFYYMDDANNIKKIAVNEWFETSQASIFAVLPYNRRVFKGMQNSSVNNFEDLATTSGGGSWKPLKTFNRVVLIKRKTSINPLVLAQHAENSELMERKLSNQPLSELEKEELNAAPELIDNLESVVEEHFDLFTGKGCYLKLNDGNLIAQWSESPVKNALAFFYPQKPIANLKYTENNTVELATKCGSKTSKEYLDGLAQYLKMTYEVDGVLKVLSRNEGEFYYMNDLKRVFRILPNTWFESTRGRVFAVLPLKKTTFEGIHECTVHKFEDMASSNGGATWKPLKLYKTYDTGQPEEQNFSFNALPTL